jgi:hypothetical protein
MPAVLTSDPIMTLLDAKEIGHIDDEQTAIVLINIVTQKFKTYTQRSRITEGAVDEHVHPLDGNTAFTFSRPIAAADVTVIQMTRTGATTTYLEADDDVIVDRVRGRIYKSGGTWDTGTGFPSLNLQYTGGWAAAPADVVAGALAQMKVEQQRLKGLVGADSFGAGGDTMVPETAGLIKSTVDSWKPYRIFAR